MGIFSNIFKKEAPPEEQVQASNRVLETLKRRRSEETGKWLNLLRDPSMIPKPPPPSTIAGVDQRDTLAGEAYTPPVDTMYTPLNLEGSAPGVVRKAQVLTVESPLADWVNLFFDAFTEQATQFNASAAGTELTLSVSPPLFAYAQDEYGAYTADKKVSSARGHIATLHWALLFHANDKKVNIYIVPSDELLTLFKKDLTKIGYTPFMTMEATEKGAYLEWKVADAVVTKENIPLLARELLGDLIRVSSGTMSENELFAHHHSELKLGDTVASGYVPAPAPANGAAQAVGKAGATAETATTAGDSADLATFSACTALLTAIDQDLAALTEQAGEFEQSGDQSALQRVHDYSARLRTLSGLASSLLADYQPRTGSKYRPS